MGDHVLDGQVFHHVCQDRVYGRRYLVEVWLLSFISTTNEKNVFLGEGHPDLITQPVRAKQLNRMLFSARFIPGLSARVYYQVHLALGPSDLSRRDTTHAQAHHLVQFPLGAELGLRGWVRRPLTIRVAESRKDRSDVADIVRSRH